MKKAPILLAVIMFVLACVASPVYAQKLPAVGSKGFENLSRSIFLKEGGLAARFPQFYKELSSSLSSQALNRSELKELTRIYLNSQVSMKSAHKMLDSELKKPFFAAEDSFPFISISNLNKISKTIWLRDQLGTEKELLQFQQAFYPILAKFPGMKLTMKELYYIISRYKLHGASFIPGYLKSLPKRQELSHITIERNGGKSLDVSVYQDQVPKLLDLFYSDKPFKIEKGMVIEL